MNAKVSQHRFWALPWKRAHQDDSNDTHLLTYMGVFDLVKTRGFCSDGVIRSLQLCVPLLLLLSGEVITLSFFWYVSSPWSRSLKRKGSRSMNKDERNKYIGNKYISVLIFRQIAQSLPKFVFHHSTVKWLLFSCTSMFGFLLKICECNQGQSIEQSR